MVAQGEFLYPWFTSNVYYKNGASNHNREMQRSIHIFSLHLLLRNDFILPVVMVLTLTHFIGIGTSVFKWSRR